ASAGAITQATGSTLTVGANSRLSITSSSEIILNNIGNHIWRLGALNSSGAITVGMTPANINTDNLNLAGNIDAGGAITIRTSGGHLVLANDITTRGGNVTIELAPTGTLFASSYSFNTSNRDLTLTAASVVAADESPVFILGSGTFSTTSTGLSATMSGGAISYHNYDPNAANRKGELIGSEDPNSTSKGWNFYGSSITSTTRTADTTVIWLNEASLVAGKVMRQVGAITVTVAGLDLRSLSGTIRYKVVKSPTAELTEYNLATDHAIKLSAVGTSADNPILLTRVLSGSTIDFNNTSFFGGDLTLQASAAITQQSGSSVKVSGKLIIEGSSAVTLKNASNGFNSLGNLKSNGQITIKSGSTVTVTGLMVSTTVDINADSGDIILSGAVSSNNSLNLTALAGSVIQAPNSTLTVSGGMLQALVGVSITLTNAGNHIVTLGNLYTGFNGGSIAVTSDDILSLNNNSTDDIFWVGPGSTITLNSRAGVRLTKDIGSRGGAVFLNLGKGSYDSRNGTASFSWNTNSQQLTLSAGGVTAGTGTVFSVGAASNFINQVENPPAFVGNHIVITNGSEAEKAGYEAFNPTAINPDYHTLAELNGSLVGGQFTNNGGTVTFASVFAAPATTATVTFWNLRNARVTRELTVAGFRFAGVNSIKSFSSHMPLTLAANSTLIGDLTVGAGGLTIEAGARILGGTIAAVGHQNLRLYFASDFVQA
ncbi:MAG: hypothetical protein ORO03_07310, partial [Alphaproteobacteria bacterium]|nr:hypothetical protein [Alphaproteobacteria bacterium]